MIMIHPRGTHRRHNGARDSRDRGIPGAFRILAGCQGRVRESERPIGTDRDFERIGDIGQFAAVLRGPRFFGGAFRGVRLLRRKSRRPYGGRLERNVNELLRGQSGLSETEAQSGQVQGGKPRFPFGIRRIRFEVPFRLSGGRGENGELKKPRRFVLPGGGRIPGNGGRDGFRELSGTVGLRRVTREKPHFSELDRCSRGRIEVRIRNAVDLPKCWLFLRFRVMRTRFLPFHQERVSVECRRRILHRP